MRKKDDPRYPVAVEAGWAIIQKHYGYTNNEDIQDNSNVVRREGPDLWARDKKVAIAIGLLREETLRRYLTHFEEVVHLPLPPVDDLMCEPTHFRVFKRNIAQVFDKKNFVVWGDSLIRGRVARDKHE
jgi:hypothetical protein